MAFYVFSYLLARGTVIPWFLERLDVVAIDIFGTDLFGLSFSSFRKINLYNLCTQRSSLMLVSPLVAFPDSPHPTLVVGDFNIHHHLPDPLRSHSSEELVFSFTYLSRSLELGYGLLNLPGVYSRFPLAALSPPSVLDFSFVTIPVSLGNICSR